MKSVFNPYILEREVGKMEKKMLTAVVVVLMMATCSFGAFIVQFSPVSQVVINPGGAFDISFDVVGDGFQGFDAWAEVSSEASGKVTLASRSTTGTVLTDWQIGSAASMTAQLLSPQSPGDLGGGDWGTAHNGTSHISNFHVTTDMSIAPGIYTIMPVRLTVTDIDWTEFTAITGGVTAQGMQFQVVPEPITLVLLSLGGLFLRRRMA